MNQAAWSIEQAEELYGIRGWGEGYFSISKHGQVLVHPDPAHPGCQISLLDIVEGLKVRGLDMPVVLRLVDIVASRIERLNEGFNRAIEEAQYQGSYRGVYPIKVNQQQQVVEEIIKCGRPYHYGLEAGSKAELIAALACMDDPEAIVVCNGYKDEEFIDLALSAQKMGMQPVLVIELPSEVELILSRSRAMGVKPLLGVRAKLSTQVGGMWNESGGDHSTFGLNASQIIDVVDTLRKEGMLDCLRMLHFHLGSQIPNIRSVRAAVTEAAQFYVGLVEEGAPMGFFDVGGGLAVDYEGSHTDSASSSNYTIDEYAADIVEAIMDATREKDVPPPTIVTEAGRAVVAHHSVLLFNVLDVSRLNLLGMPVTLPDGVHELLTYLKYVDETLTPENLQEAYHDAVHYRDDIRRLFGSGQVSLRERALAERMFWHIVSRIAELCRDLRYIPDELTALDGALADVYHANFSVFQSLPDSWAIDQLFPIMPIHRLDEQPTRQATLSDITCDCDGRINRFIELPVSRRTLPVHELNGSDYILAVFLVGAYQETLGDLHNLLGDTHVAGVHISKDGQVEYDTEIEGDTVADVLSYVEYKPDNLVEKMRKNAEAAVRAGRITAEERRSIMAAYQEGLRGYTYFES